MPGYYRRGTRTQGRPSTGQMTPASLKAGSSCDCEVRDQGWASCAESWCLTIAGRVIVCSLFVRVSVFERTNPERLLNLGDGAQPCRRPGGLICDDDVSSRGVSISRLCSLHEVWFRSRKGERLSERCGQFRDDQDIASAREVERCLELRPFRVHAQAVREYLVNPGRLRSRSSGHL